MMIVADLWREAKHFPVLLISSVVLLTLVLVTYLVQAVVIAWVLTAMLQGTVSSMFAGLAFLAILAIIRMVLLLCQHTIASRLGGRVRRVLRHRVLRSTLNTGRLHDSRARDGSLRAMLTDGVDGTDTYVSQYIPAVTQVFLACPVVVLILSLLNLWVGIWVAAAVVMAVTAPWLWKKVMSHRGLEHWDSYETLSADLLDWLKGMAMLRALGDVPGTRRKMHARSEQLRKATERVMRVSLAETGVTDFFIQAGIVAAIMTAIIHALTQKEATFELYLILMLASEAFRPIRDLSRHWHAGFLGLTAVPGLRQLGAFDSVVHDTDSDKPAGRHVVKTKSGRVLQACDLHYRYPGAEIDVLRGVNLTARRGMITVIIGASGVGKSTLFDVLLGFIEPQHGAVYLDGKQLNSGDIAVLSQRPLLFAGTIRENLAVTGDATETELEEVCRAAGLLDEVLALSDGLDSPVAEAGMSLSGGQRQRLALARALLARRPVLLVDEPTSALDATRATEVMATLRRVATERIVVMITHRTEMLTKNEEIFRLENGVLEQSIA